VIVVATANDPTSLSNALLNHPGRFDRVALFSTPSIDLRRRYLMYVSGGNFDEVEATAPALALDRFSFAQIREAYILAGQFAIDCGSEITANANAVLHPIPRFPSRPGDSVLTRHRSRRSAHTWYGIKVP
jgi:ATP-dependent 26S proteasome regulatory subunit